MMITLEDIKNISGLLRLALVRAESFSGVKANSSEVKPGDLFVAIKGTRTDGHKYIPDALKNGASGVVCEDVPQNLNTVTVVQVSNSAEFLGYLASLYYGNPSKDLIITGITGTNGKTTIATSLYHLFRSSGFPAGLISTTGVFFNDRMLPATHTTPDSMSIQKYFSEMVREGISHVFMEVSSHAADQDRIAGISFNGGIFTNLTQDHLDYHKDLKAYLYAKKKFFDLLPPSAFALVNADDRHNQVMTQNTRARRVTFGVKRVADFRPAIVEQQLGGTQIRYGGQEIWLPFPGTFSVYNLTAVFAAATLLGMEEEEAWRGITKLPPVPGRFEVFRSEKGLFAIVDYAHTPDALANVLMTISQVKEKSSVVFTVVGAGGDRDKSKRPRMARIAYDLSGRLILTSDNPRSEDPASIISDMLQGLNPEEQLAVLIQPDRAEAIKTAIAMAGPGDIVLVAGKGHETYQEIKGVRHHFDDREVIRELLKIKTD